MVLFALSFVLNLFAIIKYNSNWMELITQIHIVLFISLFLYAFSAIVRILYSGLRNLYRSFKKPAE